MPCSLTKNIPDLVLLVGVVRDLTDIFKMTCLLQILNMLNAVHDLTDSFKVTILLQIFNMLNARKIKHEYNIFRGLWRSRAFLYIFIIIVGLQLIIMLTAVGNFFTVERQNWAEWLFAIAIGAGSLLVALATKAVARTGGFCMPTQDVNTDPTGDMAMAKSALSGSDDGTPDDSTDELRGIQVHPGDQDMQAGPSNPRHTDGDTSRNFSKQTSKTRYGAVPGADAL